MSVADRLTEAGLTLPPAPRALGGYVPATRAGQFVFTAGQLPMESGYLLAEGQVGDGVSLELARRCARQAVLNALAAASTVCTLDECTQVVKLVGYVASAPGFAAQPSVLDGASDVLLTAFGESGRHAREAVGVAGLPLNAPIEVSLVLALSYET